MYKGCWRLVAGLWLQQDAEDAGDLDDWLDKQNMASGLIWQSLEQSQKALVQDLLADPVALWTRLGSLHAIESPASRFMAYDELFSINLQEGESLTSLISWVESAVQNIKMLRGTPFTLQNLDDELSSMALIRALPFESYGNFRSSLLLMADVRYNTVKEAFMQEARN